MSFSLRLASWSDLRASGIEYLTGEACALSLRGLCDVTEKGRKLLCKVLSLPANTKFADNWNNGSKTDPHVGSILLSYDLLPMLSVFACLERGGVKQAFLVHTKDGNWEGTYGYYGGEDAEEEIKEWRNVMEGFGCRLRRFAYEGTAGDRQIHEMSQRVI